MVQPVAARPLLSDPEVSGQGFLARFLIAEPASHIGTRLQRGHSPESDPAVDRFGARLRTILETPMPTGAHPQELVPPCLSLSVAARELLWRFHETIEGKQQAGGDLEHVRAFASKAAEQACRIAGVLTLWADLDATEITPQGMAQGVQLAAFYLGEAKRLADAAVVSVQTAQAEALRKWLLESWPHAEVTLRDIVRNGPSHLRETKVAREPVAMLEKAGWLIRLPEGTEVQGMARKEAFRIVRLGDVV